MTTRRMSLVALENVIYRQICHQASKRHLNLNDVARAAAATLKTL